MNRLDGKVALITGGARGQGEAEAALFVSAGAEVYITDVDEEQGVAVAERLGGACTFLRHDVASPDDWEKVIEAISERHDRIDVLVNNAGIFRVVGLEATSLELWEQIVAINQTGVFLGMKSVIPLMKKSGAGSIVNISSVAGMAATAVAHAYAATKWAVRGMSKSAAVEFAEFGIRVNSVHPGLIDTRMLNEFRSSPERLDTRVPLGRRGTVDEVARLVLFLASDDASYCSGHEYVIDGAFRA